MFHFKEVQTSHKYHFNHLDSRKRKTNVFQIVEVQISHKDVFYFYFLLKPKCFTCLEKMLVTVLADIEATTATMQTPSLMFSRLCSWSCD